jgi:hypothetical protein
MYLILILLCASFASLTAGCSNVTSEVECISLTNCVWCGSGGELCRAFDTCTQALVVDEINGTKIYITNVCHSDNFTLGVVEPCTHPRDWIVWLTMVATVVGMLLSVGLLVIGGQYFIIPEIKMWWLFAGLIFLDIMIPTVALFFSLGYLTNGAYYTAIGLVSGWILVTVILGGFIVVGLRCGVINLRHESTYITANTLMIREDASA